MANKEQNLEWSKTIYIKSRMIRDAGIIYTK